MVLRPFQIKGPKRVSKSAFPNVQEIKLKNNSVRKDLQESPCPSAWPLQDITEVIEGLYSNTARLGALTTSLRSFDHPLGTEMLCDVQSGAALTQL